MHLTKVPNQDLEIDQEIEIDQEAETDQEIEIEETTEIETLLEEIVAQEAKEEEEEDKNIYFITSYLIKPAAKLNLRENTEKTIHPTLSFQF